MNMQQYIYDNGTDKFYYVCSQCGSHAMKDESVDSCVHLYYSCQECGSTESAPVRDVIVSPISDEKVPSEAWIGSADYAELLTINNN